MTDRFVPDKPGLWFVKDPTTSGGIEVVQIFSDGTIHGICGDQALTIEADDWILPVTPPDVVAGLVSALERAAKAIDLVLPGTEQPPTAFQCHQLSVATLAVDAALQRYREG